MKASIPHMLVLHWAALEVIVSRNKGSALSQGNTILESFALQFPSLIIRQFTDMLSKDISQANFIELVFRKVDIQINQFSLAHFELIAVEHQEYVSTDGGSTLVSVGKCVIFREAKS